MPSCPICGIENAPQNKHCGQCGALLGENFPLDEQLRTDLREIKQQLFLQPRSKSVQTPSLDELQVLRIEEAARERLVRWIQISFLAVALVVGLVGLVAGFMGYNTFSGVKGTVDEEMGQMKGTIERANGQLTSAISDVKGRLESSTKEIDKRIVDLRNELDKTSSELTASRAGLQGAPTRREITLLTLYTDLFRRTIQKLTLESGAKKVIENFTISVSEDPSHPVDTNYYSQEWDFHPEPRGRTSGPGSFCCGPNPSHSS